MNALRCVYGDPTSANQAVLIGDSVGISWLPALRVALGESWGIRVYAMTQCPAVQVQTIKNDGSPFPECAEYREWTFAEVERLRPQLLIMGSSERLNKMAKATGTTPAANYHVWETATSAALARLAPMSGRTVILGTPPYGENLSLVDCVTPFNHPADCTAQINGRYKKIAASEKRAADAQAANNVQSIDTRSWFCDSSGKCPAFAGSTPIRGDGSHLSRAYSSSLGSALHEVLFPAVVDPAQAGSTDTEG